LWHDGEGRHFGGARHCAADKSRLGRNGTKGGRHGRAIIVAVSAPTALALRTAQAARITLVAIAREDGFELFTHPQRIDTRICEHVA
jgi:FdhD/NarQ family